jgi:cell division protein FtsB
MDTTNLTVPLPTVVQVFYTIALLVFGVIGWFLKGMVDRLERASDANARSILDLETKMRAERERACEETKRQIEKLRDECSDCQEQRQREHTDLVAINGRFGGRLSRLEGEHSQQRKSGAC